MFERRPWYFWSNVEDCADTKNQNQNFSSKIIEIWEFYFFILPDDGNPSIKLVTKLNEIETTIKKIKFSDKQDYVWYVDDELICLLERPTGIGRKKQPEMICCGIIKRRRELATTKTLSTSRAMMWRAGAAGLVYLSAFNPRKNPGRGGKSNIVPSL
jgi:hypothetical protein